MSTLIIGISLGLGGGLYLGVKHKDFIMGIISKFFKK